MEKKTDILVIGAGPAGMVSAITARKYYLDKKILVMKNVRNSVIPCGIPYMFWSLKNPEENKMGILPLENNNIEVIVDEAIKIIRSDAEIINLIGVAIQKRMTATELETLQMATHPYLTSAPTVYPIVIAAQEASNKI